MQELILICATIMICTLIISHTIKEIEQYKTYMETEGLIESIRQNIKGAHIFMENKEIADKVKKINEREEDNND